MTDQEKEFVHFVSCIESLNNAWRLINVIKAERDNPLVGPAFRYALIEYSKPYRESRGSGRKRGLDTSCIPADMLALHKRLTDSRNQVHAHSDLTVMDAKLYVHEVQGQRFTGIVQSRITGVEELSNIEEIQELIESTLDNMYAKEKVLEAALL
jgi:hypothetical protein